MLATAQAQEVEQVEQAEVAAKGIVYCRSRQLCEQVAAGLCCRAYHAGIPDRDELLAQWQQTGGLIVCTSALGVGVDILRILFTLHLEKPWSLVDFMQESGRVRG